MDQVAKNCAGMQPLMSACVELPAKEESRAKDRVALKVSKWNESCWEVVSYSCFSVLAFYASRREKWFKDPRHMWIGCTGLPCNVSISVPLFVLYLGEIAWYMNGLISLVIFHQGPKRKDHYQMAAHHVITLILVTYSFAMNFTRVGCMIFLLHDVCDVFLQVAKLFKYSKYESGATVGFIVFLLVWMAARVFYFPVYILNSVVIDTFKFIIIPYDVKPDPHFRILTGMLMLLYGLHIIWTYMILKVAYRTVMTKSTDDVREDSDSDSD